MRVDKIKDMFNGDTEMKELGVSLLLSMRNKRKITKKETNQTLLTLSKKERRRLKYRLKRKSF